MDLVYITRYIVVYFGIGTLLCSCLCMHALCFWAFTFQRSTAKIEQTFSMHAVALLVLARPFAWSNGTSPALGDPTPGLGCSAAGCQYTPKSAAAVDGFLTGKIETWAASAPPPLLSYIHDALRVPALATNESPVANISNVHGLPPSYALIDLFNRAQCTPILVSMNESACSRQIS